MALIYLIDDDKIFNFLNQMLIKKTKGDSCEVICFEDAQKALELLKQNLNLMQTTLPDKIFLDINMPVFDGWDFLDELNKLNFNGHNCDVYMLTSSVSPFDIAKSRTYEMVRDFISKPLTEAKLMHLI
jgi:CheY-like chemotaxis protein